MQSVFLSHFPQAMRQLEHSIIYNRIDTGSDCKPHIRRFQFPHLASLHTHLGPKRQCIPLIHWSADTINKYVLFSSRGTLIWRSQAVWIFRMGSFTKAVENAPDLCAHRATVYTTGCDYIYLFQGNRELKHNGSFSMQNFCKRPRWSWHISPQWIQTCIIKCW